MWLATAALSSLAAFPEWELAHFTAQLPHLVCKRWSHGGRDKTSFNIKMSGRLVDSSNPESYDDLDSQSLPSLTLSRMNCRSNTCAVPGNSLSSPSGSTLACLCLAPRPLPAPSSLAKQNTPHIMPRPDRGPTIRVDIHQVRKNRSDLPAPLVPI